MICWRANRTRCRKELHYIPILLQEVSLLTILSRARRSYASAICQEKSCSDNSFSRVHVSYALYFRVGCTFCTSSVSLSRLPPGFLFSKELKIDPLSV